MERVGVAPHECNVTVFNYHSAKPDEREGPFPLQLETPLGRRRALLRQEMRGLTVHAESGTLLARPLHKSWQVGQRPEMRSTEARWLLQHKGRLTLLEKLDGVMVRRSHLRPHMRRARRFPCLPHFLAPALA